MTIQTVLKMSDTYYKNEICDNKALIEIFLGNYCKNGIMVSRNSNISNKIVEKFEYMIDKNLTITNLETKTKITIPNIKYFKITEYDDYLLLIDKYNTIIIEEIP